jgi:hypothetical protein
MRKMGKALSANAVGPGADRTAVLCEPFPAARMVTLPDGVR